jgi:hypothetical protein
MIQVALDAYLIDHNTKRLRQGRGMNGRTRAMAFRDSIPKISRKEHKSNPKAAA